MSGHPRRFHSFALAAVFGTLLGCGSSDIPSQVSGSTEEAKIKGRVLVNGKPVKGGRLIFKVANANRPGAGSRTVQISPDGTYEVTTLVGQNYVETSGVKELDSPKMRQFRDDDAPLHIPSGGSESMDLNYPPIAR